MIVSAIAMSATSSSSTPGVWVTIIAVLARPFGVDVVVADAEAGDDFELGQPAHQGGVDRRRGPLDAIARMRGPHSASHRSGSGSSHNR